MNTRSERFKKEHRTQSILSWIFSGLIGLALVLFVLFVWFSLYRHFRELSRGDMVVFRDPETGALLIRRVIALGGETVEAKDGVLIIDGRYGIDEARYRASEPLDIQRIRVPEGKVFVLSDDRNYGEDSRKETIDCLGPEMILGVVKIRIRDFTVFQTDA